MAYFLNLFSPETYEVFRRSSMDVSGFRLRQQQTAGRIHPGDKFICYMTKLSRWIGVLEVTSDWFRDDTPLYGENDPFVVRFKVKPLAWLDIEKALPIHDDRVWNSLSFTRGHSKSSSQWTGRLRGSLGQLDDRDGCQLEEMILAQVNDGQTFEVDQREYAKLLTRPLC